MTMFQKAVFFYYCNKFADTKLILFDGNDTSDVCHLKMLTQ